MKSARIGGLVGVFAAGMATALAVGVGRNGTPVYTEREITQAVVDQRAAEAAVKEWDTANARAQRLAMDNTADRQPMPEPFAALVAQAMSGGQRARVDAAIARERLGAMREANGEVKGEAKPAGK